MKTIGMIGGMSWESTTLYYQLLNRLARERLGGQHSAKLVLWSIDFAPMAALQSALTLCETLGLEVADHQEYRRIVGMRPAATMASPVSPSDSLSAADAR